MERFTSELNSLLSDGVIVLTAAACTYSSGKMWRLSFPPCVQESKNERLEVVAVAVLYMQARVGSDHTVSSLLDRKGCSSRGAEVAVAPAPGDR